MRRDDMIKQRVRALRDARQFDDPDVLAYDPAPDWVHTAVAVGWARKEEGEYFSVWRLTEEGKQACESAPVGRPPLTLDQRLCRAKQKHTDASVLYLKQGVALYGVQWLREVLAAVTPEVKL